jgi:DNA-binding transcriptional MerR regulator
MRIGELATAVGIAPSTIRYYEHAGVLAAATRIRGIRHYDESQVDHLRLVTFYRSCRVSVEDLAALMRAEPAERRERAHAAVEQRIAELDRLVLQARAMKRRLRALLSCKCNGHRERCVVYRTA